MSFTLLYPGFRKKAVTFSFDDGVIQDKVTLAIRRRYQRKGTFNLNSGKSGERKFREGKDCSYLALENCRQLYQDREISSHTFSHPHRENLSLAEQREEYRKDRENLFLLFGQEVKGSAYPYGTYNADTIRSLKEEGFFYSRTTKSTYGFSLPLDFHLWHPTIHHRDRRRRERMDSFLSCQEELPLFFIWGHSYEFALDDNFSLREEICNRLRKRNDVYKGTNREIYDYVHAATMVYERDSQFHNPSGLDVYLKDEMGRLYLIPKEGAIMHG